MSRPSKPARWWNSTKLGSSDNGLTIAAARASLKAQRMSDVVKAEKRAKRLAAKLRREGKRTERQRKKALKLANTVKGRKKAVRIKYRRGSGW